MHDLSVRNIINTLRPRHNGRHFEDDIFKCIFLNEKTIPIKMSLKCVPMGAINNIPALVQITNQANQATSHHLNQWWLVYWRIYASLGLNDLRWCRIMPVHKCCTFRWKRKNLLSPTPDSCCPLLALRSIQLMTGEPPPRYSMLQLLGESGACGCNTAPVWWM